MRLSKSGGSVGAVHPAGPTIDVAGTSPRPVAVSRESGERDAGAAPLHADAVLGAFSPRSVSLFLIGCVAALTVFHLLAVFVWHGLGYDHAMGFVPLFYMDYESNAPTWFSSAILLVAGLVALAIGSRSRAGRWHWMAMGFIAIFLSFDESAQLHEMISVALRSVLAVGPGFSWAIVALVSALPILLGVALFYRFIRSLPRQTALGLMAAGAVYVSGVVGVDTIAALVHAQEGGRLLQTTLNTVEELLEMAGIILLIHVLLTHLSRQLHAAPADADTGTAAA